ncbi:unnamed protein product [Rotaria magnacalcarata]|uniref:RING-type domain-containing protein n=1 Tax=Rotaria magnacalcarata TaxID=392030 RepID=A0A816LTS9_9BILA|nr:unnamed protein product [Rotaria magnacalcarata]CAF4263400.1 unnamed protein product [Rotaria magnacalcarata]
MDKIVIETTFANSLFKCSLCNGLIHLATVINECFHRFCKLCIVNYFEKNHNACPTCQIIIVNPLQKLKFDLTFQRLLYKLYSGEIACKSSLLPTNELTRIQIETKINVYLEYWDISLDLFPNESRTILSKCYLQCQAGTPLVAIEKFLRIKHSLSSTMKIDLFYESFLLDIDSERLIDICYCFDITNKNSSLVIRFTVSPYGYKAIMKRIRQSKQPTPLKIDILEPIANSSLSSTSSVDSKLKVKLCRSQSSTNDWYISQSKTPSELPDLINSCENRTDHKPISLKKKTILNKPRRRRIRFIPTMVRVPPSIFDRLSNKQYDFDIFQSNEMNVDNNLTDIFDDVQQTSSNQKTVCKVPPYTPETSSLYDNAPLDLSLK